MKTRLPSLFAALGVLALLHCGGGDDGSTPMTSEGDALAVQRIVGTWEATSPHGKVTMTLCEDLTADGTQSTTCECRHVVRGEGRGKTESVSLAPPSGCEAGGCLYDTSAFVVGTVGGEALGTTVAVHGSVALKEHNAPDPYVYPYLIHLGSGDSGVTSFSVNGTVASDDTMSNMELYANLQVPDVPDAGDDAQTDAAEAEDASSSVDASDDGATDASQVPTPSPTGSASSAPTGSGSSGAGPTTNRKIQESALVFHRVDRTPAACAH